jgi:hypothetical protein
MLADSACNISKPLGLAGAPAKRYRPGKNICRQKRNRAILI